MTGVETQDWGLRLRDVLDAEGMVQVWCTARSEPIPSDSLLMALASRSGHEGRGRAAPNWQIYRMPRDAVVHAIGHAMSFVEQLALWRWEQRGRVLVLAIDAAGRYALGTLPTGAESTRHGGATLGLLAEVHASSSSSVSVRSAQ